MILAHECPEVKSRKSAISWRILSSDAILTISMLIHWSVSPEILALGPIHLRWYGLLFASGFLIAFKVMERMMIREGQSPEPISDLLVYLMIGTVAGARLGHCLFYEPEIYLRDPLRILAVWEGGLASHGGTIGCLIAVSLFFRKYKYSKLWFLDRLCIPIAITSGFIRLGNLMNSEILGKPTTPTADGKPWGVIFENVDKIPRHPGQVYESLWYFFTFFLMTGLARKTTMFKKPGMSFGIFLWMIFGSRIVLELFKENQVDFENGMSLNMGQWLSIPFVIAGSILIFRSFGLKPQSPRHH